MLDFPEATFDPNGSLSGRAELSMNWTLIGTIAEILAAIGVIVSLFYLAQQIRKSNLNDRVSANQEVGRDYATHCALIMSDENIGTFFKGLNNYSELTAEERYRFDFCMTGYVNIAETILYHNEGKRITEVLEMVTGNFGPRIFAYPGAKDWWSHGKKVGFADSTQEWVDYMLENYQGTPTFWEHESEITVVKPKS